MKRFDQSEKSVEARRAEATNILEKNPGFVPIVLTWTMPILLAQTGRLPENQFMKLSTSRNATIGTLVTKFREKYAIHSHETVVIMFENKLMSHKAKIGQLYDEYRNPTDLLFYLQVAVDNAFGTLVLFGSF